jgi:hypothetical protein
MITAVVHGLRTSVVDERGTPVDDARAASSGAGTLRA